MARAFGEHQTVDSSQRRKAPPKGEGRGGRGIEVFNCTDKGWEEGKMDIIARLRDWWLKREKPVHLRRGELGEAAARSFLCRQGLKFLAANFRSSRGEIDLVFRDDDCLVFVEVKTRSSEDWTRPAAAVNARKRRLLCQTGLDYLHRLRNPTVKIRFDIVEVLLEGGLVCEVRHLPNSFVMERPYRYG